MNSKPHQPAPDVTARGLILTCLKEAYFRRLKAEKHGKTPRLTQEIDLLELAIRDLTEQIKNEPEQSESWS
jgi:hypothetical protein